MKTRKLTKRQLLNALLDAEEKQDKIRASGGRLLVRENKLRKVKEEFSEQLAKILQKENKEAGDDEDDHEPIVFKQHMFQVTYTWMCGSRRYECDVTSVRNVS